MIHNIQYIYISLCIIFPGNNNLKATFDENTSTFLLLYINLSKIE